jgi:hypothetical protein
LRGADKLTNNDKVSSMKINQLFAVCGLAAALVCGACTVSTQDNNGGGGRGNFDPAQFQQRMMDRVRDQLNFTNDEEWSQIQPLVQKVMDARRDIGFGGNMRLFSRNRNGNGQNDDNGGRRFGGMFGGQPSPEAEALKTAIDDNAPDAQVKDLLAKYKASQKAKQDKLKAAQENLRQYLSVKQEATATLLGLLD